MKKLFFNIIIGLFVFTSCGLFNKVTKTKTTDIVHVEATKVVEDHTEASSTLLIEQLAVNQEADSIVIQTIEFTDSGIVKKSTDIIIYKPKTTVAKSTESVKDTVVIDTKIVEQRDSINVATVVVKESETPTSVRWIFIVVIALIAIGIIIWKKFL